MKAGTLSVWLAFLWLAGAACGQDALRTFTDPDGERTFTAEILRYDHKQDTVTVRMKSDGRQVTFKLSRLSESDRDYLKGYAQQVAAENSFKFSFKKFMDETGANESGDTKTTTYNGGYQITLANFSTTNVENVTVESLTIWRKDTFDGMGDEQLVRGTHPISTAIAGLNERITTASIPMESRAKKSVLLSAGVAGGCASCGGSRSSATYSKPLKSRDILVGCIVQVKVDGKVVSTAASGPAILRKFKDEFTSAER